MKGRSTQSIVNAYPLWTNTRSDEQSAGYQFMNVAGRRFDDLRKQSQHIFDNLFLASSVVSDIDVFYSMKLPGDFEFTKEDDDETELLYTAPTVSGIFNGIQYSIQVASNNDIETFWYSLAPDRVSTEVTASGEHLLLDDIVINSPFSTVTNSGEMHLTNHLHVTITSGESFLGIEDQQLIRRGIVQIEGTTREGRLLTEELNFIHDETLQTFHDFRSLEPSGIRVYGVEPSGAWLKIESGRFGADDYPVNYQLDEAVTGQEIPLFWALGETTQSGLATLDLKKYDLDDLELRMNGFVTKQVVLQQELRDTLGANIAAVDIAVEPHSDALWVVDSNTLYRFSAELPYPDLSVLRGKNYSSNAIIKTSSDYAVYGDEVAIDYIWKKPTTGLIAHRVWMIKPDGTKFSLESGAEETYNTSAGSWIYGEPKKRAIRDTETYTLNQYGDYVFAMEVRYTDDTTSVDKRVITVLTQTPTAEFALAPLGITNNITGVDFDSEAHLWVSDTDNVKYRIDLHYDRMLVDFERKILYFREPYDQVRVS